MTGRIAMIRAGGEFSRDAGAGPQVVARLRRLALTRAFRL